MPVTHRLVKIFVRALIIAALTLIISVYALWYSGMSFQQAITSRLVITYPVMVIVAGILLALLFKLALTTLVPVKSFYALGYNAAFILFLAFTVIFINHSYNYNKRHGYNEETQDLLGGMPGGIDVSFETTPPFIGTAFNALREEISHPRDLHVKSFFTRFIDTLVQGRQDTIQLVYFTYRYEQDPKIRLFSRIRVFHDRANAELWDESTQNNPEYAAVKKAADADRKERLEEIMRVLPDSVKQQFQEQYGQ